MSTTVTYKGETLTTVENETKTLETAGTYLEDDITLTDVSGGGGEPDHWVRPADWPDLSVLDRSGEVIYVTCFSSEQYGYIDVNIRTSNNGPYIAEMGNIVDGQFIADYTWDFTHYTSVKKYYGAVDSDYVVFKFTPKPGTHFTGVKFGDAYAYAYKASTLDGGTRVVTGQFNGILEVYGNAPYVSNYLGCRVCKYIQSFDVLNVAPNTLNYACSYSNKLVNVDVSTWNTSNVTNFDSAFRDCPIKYFKGIENIDVRRVTSFSRAFTGIDYDMDISAWKIESATNMGAMFENAKFKSVKLKNSELNCSYDTILGSCYHVTNIDLSEFDASRATNIVNMFINCEAILNLDFGSLDLSGITTINNSRQALNGLKMLKKVTIPATLGYLGTAFFANSAVLKEIHFAATTPPTIANSSIFFRITDATPIVIYVPYSADHSVLEAYQNATNWSSLTAYLTEEPAP